MTKPKATKTEKTPLLTTHKVTTPAPAVTRSVMLVTPALAAEWLKSNTRNRRIDATAVSNLASVIRGGGWRTTHQGIAFGADGALYDGQHRLSAIVEAGVGVHVEVTRGLDTDSLGVIDNGGKGVRRPADVLRITKDIDLGRNEVGALMAAYQIVEAGNLVCNPRQTPETLGFAEETYGAALRAIHGVLLGAHAARISCAPVVSTLIVAWKSHPAAAVKFAAMLRDGENLPARHPALALRNHLMMGKAKASGGGASRDGVSLRVAAAFDAFVRGETLGALKANAGARDRFAAAWKIAG